MEKENHKKEHIQKKTNMLADIYKKRYIEKYRNGRRHIKKNTQHFNKMFLSLGSFFIVYSWVFYRQNYNEITSVLLKTG